MDGVRSKWSEGLDSASQAEGDRKSTRLNFSHVRISYAVFCLKKKKYWLTNIRNERKLLVPDPRQQHRWVTLLTISTSNKLSKLLWPKVLRWAKVRLFTKASPTTEIYTCSLHDALPI